MRIHGFEVLGTVDQLPGLCAAHEVDELLIAIPSATLNERQRILRRCRECSVPTRTVPIFIDLLQGRAAIGQLAKVQPEYLLDRHPERLIDHALDRARLQSAFGRKPVIVTGAAGSIGAELCRQLALVGTAGIGSALLIPHLTPSFAGFGLLPALVFAASAMLALALMLGELITSRQEA